MTAWPKCRDELCLCQKDFYAVNQSFACPEYYNNDYVDPPFADSFECRPCDRGYFCHGGVDKFAWGARHATPRRCPFEGTVARTDLLRFVNPCQMLYPNPSYSDPPCNEDYEIRSACLDKPSDCPCACPGTNVALLDAPGALGGKQCGCAPGTYWSMAANSTVRTCVQCLINAFCPGNFPSLFVDEQQVALYQSMHLQGAPSRTT